jgi:hypothetical protein
LKTLIIATYGRSGSTILSSLFGSIPGYHMSGENNDALWGLYQSFCAVRDGHEQTLKRKRRTEPTGPWYMMDQVDPGAYAARLIDLFFEQVVRVPEGCVGRGFKEIRFFHHRDEFAGYLDFLLDHVPDCLILFNQRDHGSVAKSGWWKKMPEAKVREKLTEFDAMMRAFAARRPSQALICRYEDWTADPATLRPVFERLGAEMDLGNLRRMLDEPLTHGKKPVAPAMTSPNPTKKPANAARKLVGAPTRPENDAQKLRRRPLPTDV